MSKTAIIGNAIAQGIADYLDTRWKDRREKRDRRLKIERRFEDEDIAEQIRNLNSYNKSKATAEQSNWDAQSIANQNKINEQQYIADRQDKINAIKDLEFDIRTNNLNKDSKISRWANNNANKYINNESARLGASTAGYGADSKVSRLRGRQADVNYDFVPIENELKLATLGNKITEQRNLRDLIGLEAEARSGELRNAIDRNEILKAIMPEQRDIAINNAIAGSLESNRNRMMYESGEAFNNSGVVNSKLNAVASQLGIKPSDLSSYVKNLSDALSSLAVKDPVTGEITGYSNPELADRYINVLQSVNNAIESNINPNSMNSVGQMYDLITNETGGNDKESNSVIESILGTVSGLINNNAKQQVAGKTAGQLTQSGINNNQTELQDESTLSKLFNPFYHKRKKNKK